MPTTPKAAKVEIYAPGSGASGGEATFKNPANTIDPALEPNSEIQLREGSGDAGLYHSVKKVVGRTVRTVLVETAVFDGQVSIGSLDRGPNGAPSSNHHGIEIQSKPVAHAFADAMERAFSKGEVSAEDVVKFEKLRQTVAAAGVNDGKFDPVETQAIVKRASEIAPQARTRK